MAERETAAGLGPVPETNPSVLGWAERWLQSDVTGANPTPARPPPGEPCTRSFDIGANDTGADTPGPVATPQYFAGYEVLKEIGQGGMGWVFQVRHPKTRRVEALKLISPRCQDKLAARVRFEREFLALAAIEHPNIVTVYDAGTWKEFPYFTMRYVAGGALSDHLARFRHAPAAAARLVAKVARAVHHLHAAGVLHRDLKPHNILLGDDDEPLVADFGLVKHLGEDTDATVTGIPMGTRQYMSPEQTRGDKALYSPACDIWAIGVILYELLGGTRPFHSDDPIDLYGKIREANPPPLLGVNPAAPRGLAAVAHRCLARDPVERYPSAAAVAADLEAWLGGEAVTATLPPPPHRRRARRRGATVAVAIACLAVGLAGYRVWPTPVPGGEPTGDTRTPAVLGSVGKELAAGKTVELIGPVGPPKVLQQAVKDSGGLLADDGEMPCRFTTFQFGMLDLVTEELPLPVRLEAEVALYTSRPAGSFAGVHVGRRRWAGAGGHDSAVLCDLTLAQAPPDTRHELAELRTVWAAPADKAPDRGRLASAGFPPAPDAADQVHWRKLSVTITPTAVRAVWDGLPELTATEADLRTWVWQKHNALALAPPPADGPALGSGLGLTVGAGEGLFRNVRLIPLTPSVPNR